MLNKPAAAELPPTDIFRVAVRIDVSMALHSSGWCRPASVAPCMTCAHNAPLHMNADLVMVMMGAVVVVVVVVATRRNMLDKRCGT